MGRAGPVPSPDVDEPADGLGFERQRLSFGGWADDYERYRPGYPPEAVAWMVDHAPPARVVDVGAGTGRLSAVLLALGHDVVAVEPDEGMRAVAEAAMPGRTTAGSAEALPLADASVDALVHTYLLRYVDDVEATLRELARPVKPGGVIASLDFAVPAGGWYPPWWLWTRIGLPAGGLIAGDGWFATGRFLGPNIEAFWRRHPIDELLAAWAAAGIGDLRWQRLSKGGSVIIRGIKS